MAYPKRLLSPGEEIVREFRPHWQVLLLPIVLFVIAVVAVVVAAVTLEGAVAWVTMVGALAVWLLVSIARLADWFTTHYVITNERVVYRAGVFARSGIEIPLESITNVSFRQGFLERLIRSGDLIIESAGETGRSSYTDIPDPEGLQSLIYQQREARTMALEGGRGSVVDEIEGLARLRDQGLVTEEEFETRKRRLLEG